MLSRPLAFRLENVSKTYQVYQRPLDRMWELLTRRPRHRAFTALHPLTLDIPAGRCLGIVGENGAGKSTLLHLLAGSHHPTTGRIERQGTVLGLLELGVGFHPEFSGRENIFFYGDTLGLPRGFVRSRFDEVVAFSELGAFIDQPLRTYSTGMRVRLAFALVASLDPDILIVDEALSVGDLHFQKKCIDRMTEFRQGGKTIVFCSHSLYHIGMFCDEVLWFDRGGVRAQGDPAEVLPAYEAYQMSKDARPQALDAALPGRIRVRLRRLEVLSPNPMDEGDDLRVEWQTEADEAAAYHVSISLKMDSGRGVFVTGSHLRQEPPLSGPRRGLLEFPRLPLMGGHYRLHCRVWDDQGLMVLDERVIDDVTVRKRDQQMGLVRLDHQWVVAEAQAEQGNCAVGVTAAATPSRSLEP